MRRYKPNGAGSSGAVSSPTYVGTAAMCRTPENSAVACCCREGGSVAGAPAAGAAEDPHVSTAVTLGRTVTPNQDGAPQGVCISVWVTLTLKRHMPVLKL